MTKLLFNWITFDDIKPKVQDLLCLFYTDGAKSSFSSTFIVQINELLIDNYHTHKESEKALIKKCEELELKYNSLASEMELLKQHVFGNKS